VSGAFGAIWVFAAWARPENSYFMFPFFVAAAVPVSYRLAARRALPVGIAVGSSIAGLFNVFLIAALLAIGGKLEGPTILPFGGSVVEAIVVGFLGALVGIFLATVDVSRRKVRR
jgi:hypothetical protein